MKQNKKFPTHPNNNIPKSIIYIENKAEDHNNKSSNNYNLDYEIDGEEEIEYYDEKSPNENAVEYNYINMNDNYSYSNSFPNYSNDQNQIEYYTFQGNNKQGIMTTNLNQSEEVQDDFYDNNDENNNNGINNEKDKQKNNKRENKEKKIEKHKKDSKDFQIQGINMKIENKYINNNDNIKKKESIKKDINQNKKIKNTNKNSDTKHHEINDGQNIYKQSPNESNNKNIEKDKIIDKGKITNNTSSVKNYLNNYINSNYKTVSSEKINNENYNDLTLKTFNNSSNYENDVYNSVGKKALTKLKYNYYKNMSQSNDYRLNEANKNYLNNINLDNNNNKKNNEEKKEKRKHQSDIVQEIINKYKYPITYKFNIQSERKNLENISNKYIPINKNTNFYQKIIKVKIKLIKI